MSDGTLGDTILYIPDEGNERLHFISDKGDDRPRWGRFTLLQVMIVVALVAVLFAVLPAWSAVIISIVLLVVAGVTMAIDVPWTRRVLWILSVYPALLLGSLYATWFAAWISLGHMPRGSIDDPKRIGVLVDVPYELTCVLLFGYVGVALACLVALFVDFVFGLSEGRGKAAALAALPVLSWPLSLAWLFLDPGHVVVWFFD